MNDDTYVDTSTLELIRITHLCEAFHSLPAVGGVLDQDPLLLHGMQIVLEVQAEKMKLEQERAKKS